MAQLVESLTMREGWLQKTLDTDKKLLMLMQTMTDSYNNAKGVEGEGCWVGGGGDDDCGVEGEDCGIGRKVRVGVSN